MLSRQGLLDPQHHPLRKLHHARYAAARPIGFRPLEDEHIEGRRHHVVCWAARAKDPYFPEATLYSPQANTLLWQTSSAS